MKKLFVLLLAVLFFAGAAYGAEIPTPAYEHIVIEAARGADPAKPAQVVKLVRYGRAGHGILDNKLSSGDVVVWDTSSNDGVTVSACVTSNDNAYAGVLVTDILTAGSGVIDKNDKNWGYICVRGYCLANIAEGATVGYELYPAGHFADIGNCFTTIDQAIGTGSDNLSSDTGTLLETSAVASGQGLHPVMLR